MKHITLLGFLFSVTTAYSQNIISGYWLPLKRLSKIDHFNIDTCSIDSDFPFKKIKFLTNTKISLFEYNMPDPNIYRISPLKEKGAWLVHGSIIAPDLPFYKGSKIVLKIKNDTLYSSVIKSKDTLIQKFIKKYNTIKLKDYTETEIGNLWIKGKYTLNNKTIIEFKENGKIEIPSNDTKSLWNFKSYRFNFYSQDCFPDSSQVRKIVQFINSDGKSEFYVIKEYGQRLDFYKAGKMIDTWSPKDLSFRFSLIRIR